MIDVKEIKAHKNLPPDYYDWGLKHNFFQWLWHSYKYYQVRKVFLKTLPLNRVLDFGSASGTAIDKITRPINKKIEIHAVDIIQELIHYGRKKRPHIIFKKIDGINLPYENNFFEIVTALDVLEHVSNFDKVILEISRCLKKGGKLIIMVPNENFLWKIVWGAWTFGKGRVWKEAHINDFNLNFLVDYLKKKGFEIEKKVHTHLSLNNFIIAKKI